jgi:3-methyladenine DNA glycosylase AlkD
MTFIQQLSRAFEEAANPEFAAQMKSYLRDKFELYGIKTNLRRDILKTVVRDHILHLRDDIRVICFDLYNFPQREMHLCATELFEKQLRNSYKKSDIQLIEALISNNSWWDTVDFIAKQILGKYLITYPDETKYVIGKFSQSENMWLNRSAILFQLGYKNKTDEDLFYSLCLQHKHSNEFFIQKAIGWALREYGKTNPDSVLKFVESADLKPLSKKEAIRNILK